MIIHYYTCRILILSRTSNLWEDFDATIMGQLSAYVEEHKNYMLIINLQRHTRLTICDIPDRRRDVLIVAEYHHRGD